MCNYDSLLKKIKIELEDINKELREKTYSLAQYAIILSGFYISATQFLDIKIETITWSIRFFMISILLIYTLLLLSAMPFHSFSFIKKNGSYQDLAGKDLEKNVNKLYKTVQRNILNHGLIIFFMFASLILFSANVTEITLNGVKCLSSIGIAISSIGIGILIIFTAIIELR